MQPVLVGVGRVTQRRPASLDDALDPIALAADASRAALSDAGLAVNDVDAIYFIDMLGDMRLALQQGAPAYANPPRALASAIGASHVHSDNLIKSEVGGNMPQFCVNEAAERVVRGEIKCALLTGAEAIDTMVQGTKKGLERSPTVPRTSERDKVQRWGDGLDPVGDAPRKAGKPGKFVTIHDLVHGLVEMPPCYALLEQAVRRHDGVSERDRRRSNARLFSGYAAEAAAPENAAHAWFPTARSENDIAETEPSRNRMVAFPYPKLMCAIMDVNQAASVLLTSASHARALGVPEDKLVFLRGCGDTEDVALRVSEKPELHRCHGMRIAGAAALQSAEISIADVKYFDVYSCFPVAVRLACRELGIEKSVLDVDDAKQAQRLTVTGGLPFHGGPGNNYSMHGIAAMVERLRADRGSFGLVTANGGVVSKHAVGVYSTTAPPGHERPWRRPDTSEALRRAREATPPRQVCKDPGPECEGELLTFTVSFPGGSKGRPTASVLGDILTGHGKGMRFIAASKDSKVVEALLQRPDELLGAKVRLKTEPNALGRKGLGKTTFELMADEASAAKL